MAEAPLLPLLEYGFSRGFKTNSQCYAAAHEGLIPTIRIGRLRFVPVEQADRALGIAPRMTEAGAPSQLRSVG